MNNMDQFNDVVTVVREAAVVKKAMQLFRMRAGLGITAEMVEHYWGGTILPAISEDVLNLLTPAWVFDNMMEIAEVASTSEQNVDVEAVAAIVRLAFTFATKASMDRYITKEEMRGAIKRTGMDI